MTVIRRNILTSDEARDRFLSDVVMLAQKDAGTTAVAQPGTHVDRRRHGSGHVTQLIRSST